MLRAARYSAPPIACRSTSERRKCPSRRTASPRWWGSITCAFTSASAASISPRCATRTYTALGKIQTAKPASSRFLPDAFSKSGVRIDWDGEQTRDYVFVDDVARCNVLALDRGSGGSYVI